MEPWETHPDFWKRQGIDTSKVKEEIGIGIRPKVKIVFSLSAETELYLTSTEELKNQIKVNPKTCSAFVKERNSWFRYSRSRNLWMQVKPELEQNE